MQNSAEMIHRLHGPRGADRLNRRADWISRPNEPQTDAQTDAPRQSLRRGRPFGSAEWQKQTAQTLRLQSTLRERGRPRKELPHQ